LAVAVLALFMVTIFEVAEVPVASPLQLVKTYWIPVPPETVSLETTALSVLPESYHPLPLGEPYAEFTFR